MSDVRKFSVSLSARLHFRDAGGKLMYADDANGNPDTAKPMAARLFGPGSKQYAEAESAQSTLLMGFMSGKGDDETAAQRRERQSEFLANCTESFENIDYDDKTGHALFVAVYSDITIGFLAEQVGKFIRNWENFQKVSSAI